MGSWIDTFMKRWRSVTRVYFVQNNTSLSNQTMLRILTFDTKGVIAEGSASTYLKILTPTKSPQSSCPASIPPDVKYPH